MPGAYQGGKKSKSGGRQENHAENLLQVVYYQIIIMLERQNGISHNKEEQWEKIPKYTDLAQDKFPKFV